MSSWLITFTPSEDMYTDAARKKSMTLKEKMKDTLSIGKQGKSEDMLKEMNLKMQRVLEETLEKNIQMEKVQIPCYFYHHFQFYSFTLCLFYMVFCSFLS